MRMMRGCVWSFMLRKGRDEVGVGSHVYLQIREKVLSFPTPALITMSVEKILRF